MVYDPYQILLAMHFMLQITVIMQRYADDYAQQTEQDQRQSAGSRRWPRHRHRTAPPPGTGPAGWHSLPTAAGRQPASASSTVSLRHPAPAPDRQPPPSSAQHRQRHGTGTAPISSQTRDRTRGRGCPARNPGGRIVPGTPPRSGR